jgi:hypothetical protein
MSLYSGKATDHVVFDRLFQAKETCAVSYKNNPGNTGMAKQEEEWRASRKSACEAVQRKSGDETTREPAWRRCALRVHSPALLLSVGDPGTSWLAGERSIFLASPIPWNVRKSHQHQHQHRHVHVLLTVNRISRADSTTVPNMQGTIATNHLLSIHKLHT